ncbi:MAG: hypothetical protein AB7J40_04435 [Candidatus Altimarinota bacterium]
MKKPIGILLGIMLLTACSPTITTLDADQMAIDCASANGKWLEDHRECEYVSKEWCDQKGGTFNECGSACRHNPESQICTKQCVIFCKF